MRALALALALPLVACCGEAGGGGCSDVDPEPRAEDFDIPCIPDCLAPIDRDLGGLRPGEAGAALLAKRWIAPCLMAHEVLLALGPAAGEGRTFDVAGILAEDLVLAAPEEARLEEQETIEADEILARYREQAARWTAPARAAYVQAILQNDDPGTERAAREAAREFLASMGPGSPPAKRAGAGFSIGFEPMRALTPGDSLAGLLAGAPPGAAVGPVDRSGAWIGVVAVVVEAEAPRVRPLPEVREEIEREIGAERRERRLSDLAREADLACPIVLSPAGGSRGERGGPRPGTIGREPIDDAFVSAVQALRPAFHRSSDPAEFAALLRSHYSIPRTLAARVRRSEPGIAGRKDDVATARRFARDLLVARRWEEGAMQGLEVTEEQARAWYDAHRARFVVPGSADVLLAFLDAADPATIGRAGEALLRLAGPRGAAELPKERGEGFVAVARPGLVEAADPLLWDGIRDLPPGEIGGPLPAEGGARQALVLVVRRLDDGRLPFESVRAGCEAEVRAGMVRQRREELMARARQMVPSRFR